MTQPAPPSANQHNPWHPRLSLQTLQLLAAAPSQVKTIINLHRHCSHTSTPAVYL